MADRKPPLGGMILLHASAADPTAPCMYCGKPQPWGDMEPCDGPLPLRAEINSLRGHLDRIIACLDGWNADHTGTSYGRLREAVDQARVQDEETGVSDDVKPYTREELERELAEPCANCDGEGWVHSSVRSYVPPPREPCPHCRMRATARAGLEDRERLDWWEAQRTRTLAPVMDAGGWHLMEPTTLRRVSDGFSRDLRGAIDAERRRSTRSGRDSKETSTEKGS